MLVIKHPTLLAVTVLFFLFSFLPAFAQESESEMASTSHFVFPEEEYVPVAQDVLDRISRLSELYIKSEITPEELAELKSLGSDIQALDRYKIAYEVKLASGAKAAADAQNGTEPESAPVTMAETPQSMPETKILHRLMPFAFPLAAINTLILLLLAGARPKNTNIG